MMEKMGMCDWISWLIGLVAAIVVYLVSVEAVTWIPALLIAIAVGCFVGLVLSHLFCGGAEAEAAQTDTAGSSETAAPAAEDAAPAAAAPEAAEAAAEESGAGEADADAAEEAGADDAATAGDGGGGAAKSTLLAGEEELAARKGTWKYQAEGAPAAASAADTSTPDYDQDGVHEGEDEGTRPEALSGPRNGKADNLKEIKGIGPKLEKLCNELGFFHFDQIAGWSADEIAWVNANLQGFKGRVSRDNWVEQARILAAGGETEFSKRVDDGEVY